MKRLWFTAAVLAGTFLLFAGAAYAQQSYRFTSPGSDALCVSGQGKPCPYNMTSVGTTPPSSAIGLNDSALTSGALPRQFRLLGLEQTWQVLNRCSAGALTIQLSFFDWGGTYQDVIHGLNPYSGDVSVRLDEMVTFVEAQGFKAVARTGGTIELMKQLVWSGFPVLVENVYYDGPDGWDDWMSHNRVIMGYDEDRQELYTFDSLLGSGADGKGHPMDYADFDERWRPFNRDYLVIYRPQDEAALQVVLGEQWDVTQNAEWTLEQAQRDLAAGKNDSFTLFNAASAELALGQVEEAAATFDQARQVGLPWRMLWYLYGPFEAYLQTGRYDDVLSLVWTVTQSTDGVEEMYYYAGRAYEAKGDLVHAQENYRFAASRNPHFAEAVNALAALTQTGAS